MQLTWIIHTMHADLRAELDAAHFLRSDKDMLLVRILRRVKLEEDISGIQSVLHSKRTIIFMEMRLWNRNISFGKKTEVGGLTDSQRPCKHRIHRGLHTWSAIDNECSGSRTSDRAAHGVPQGEKQANSSKGLFSSRHL
jgi:hypothetical protein